jgi:dipeptidyl aminopeptidase/acylaminoacyl peptidase
MNVRSTMVIAALLLTAADARAQDPFSGQWQGYWSRAGDTMTITLAVKRDAATNRHSATFDADRLRVTGIPFTDVQVHGCCNVTMTLRGDRTTSVFTGVIRDKTFAGTFQEGPSGGTFAYTRVPAGTAALEEKEVTFQNGAVSLAGSLIMPPSGGVLPAIVFVHGSGAEGRWASRFLAMQVARRGFAALIYDKRGVGKSTGDWRTAGLADLADDAVAAVAQLRKETRIDPRRVGIHGHSQGGTLAPMIAARSRDVAFVIASAAAGLPTDSVEIFSILNSVYPQATTAADSASARAYVTELVAVAYHGRSRQRLDSLVAQLQGRNWFFAPPAADHSYWSFSREFAQYEPLTWWRQVGVPVLLIYGAEDQRVPAAQSAARISAELMRGRDNVDLTIRILPGADHTFRMPPGAGGWPTTAPDYLSSLLNWLSARR